MHAFPALPAVIRRALPRIRSLLILCLCFGVAPLMQAPALAQAPAPAPAQVPAQQGAGASPAADAGAAPQHPSPAALCKTRPDPAFRNGAVTLQPAKNWQPAGGHVDLKLEPLQPLPLDAVIVACFQWRNDAGEPLPGTRPVLGAVQVTKTSAASEFDLRVTVPALPAPPNGSQPAHQLLVPLANLRIVAASAAGAAPLLDVVVPLGIQSQLWAFCAAAVLTGLVMAGIWRYSRKVSDLRQASWALRVIASRNGYASLSQFQIILWTLVVGFSAIYVMILSGTLIEISETTLGLLGIAGAATLLSQFSKKTADDSEAKKLAGMDDQARADYAAQQQQAVLQRAAEEGRAPGMPRRPRWSDLIAGTGTGEVVDVTRLQMLLFTLITASFVLVKVLTGNEIPDIPAGYLILMGISNGVYIGSKSIR